MLSPLSEPPRQSSTATAWWPIWFVAVFLIGGLTTCRQATVEAIHDAALWEDAQGRPLDNAGDRIRCPMCEAGILVWQRGYNYRCEQCRGIIQARYDSESGRTEFFR